MSTITIPADLSEPYPDTMADPRSEGRGLVVGVVLGVAAWVGIAWLAWAVFG